MNQEAYNVIILLGSNISPTENLKKALDLLSMQLTINDTSQVWENAAFGSPGPNFYNAAVSATTLLPARRLVDEVLHPIENQLGRIRTQDKNAPRTIDLDIILHDQIVLDKNIWSRLHIALPVSELLPDLVNPSNNQTLAEAAQILLSAGWARCHPELFTETRSKKKLCS
jgi:2-amino-4-hydroxy-6-hydroxymethyldihydropteridine diphosphokinase